MSFPRYPKYKDSGVEWLGEVPEHWEVIPKLKDIASFSGGGTPSRENLTYWGGDIPWVSPKDMKTERIINAEESITEEGLRNSASSLLSRDCVVMVVRSGILKHTIPVAINETRVALNQDMKALHFNGRCSSRFFLRWVQGLNDRLLLVWAKQGATVESIEQGYLSNTAIPLPPLSEQTGIVAFLDRETAKIDELVAEQRRLIELLKEKRQAVISHAVTKGLNPQAKMKDSGIDWLGEIPEDWAIQRLSNVCSFQSGKAHEPFIEDEGDFICVNSRFVSTDGETRKRCSKNLSPAQRNDILMVMSDLPNGRALAKAFFVDDDGPYAVNQRVCILSARTASPRFLYYQLNRNRLFLQRDDGINQTHLPNEAFTKFPTLVPPIPQQIAIAAFLDCETGKFDTLTAEAQRAIDLLQERRTALISAAVTGQVDVRPLAEKQAA